MSYKTSASCPRKAKARRDTIVDTYRELFSKSLPYRKQYWTLAGPCFDESGKLGSNSEIWQLTSAGLIFARQYHGIDNSEEIIEKNTLAAPGANFYHGDFVTQLQIQAECGVFNPGIIHADFTKLKETSVTDIGNIVYLVDNADVSDVMIVCNFPWNNPYKGRLSEEINPVELLDLLQSNQRFNMSWSERWSLYPKFYEYGGTGEKSATTMFTFVIYRT